MSLEVKARQMSGRGKGALSIKENTCSLSCPDRWALFERPEDGLAGNAPVMYDLITFPRNST
ncbi:hypothetical protein AVEN_16168-1, partial [Araneus ventricosus]